MTKKRVTLALTILMVALLSVGGTLAWLKAQSGPVINTFAPTSIGIDLNETTGTDYNMVPGAEIKKDPAVTVAGGSEACWLFVKVTDANNAVSGTKDYLSYGIADGWTIVPGETDVYYRKVAASTDDQPFAVLKDNKVTVNGALTKQELDALKQSGKSNYPTITVTAYAIQQLKFETPAAAWAEAKNF